jgi:hypothetical protein
MILPLIAMIYLRGLIYFLILIYCLCLLYVILYILISFFNWIYYFIFKEQDQQANMYSFYIYHIRRILGFIAQLIFKVCLFVIGKLTGIFLTLYLIYFVARLIGFHIVLIILFKVFRDCVETGLFDFFDQIVIAIFGFESFGQKLLRIIFGTFDFAQGFAEQAVFLTTGHMLDLNFFRKLDEIANNISADDIKDKVLDLISEKTPVIKVNYVKPKDISDIEKMAIEYCDKKHTRKVPDNADIIEGVRMAFEDAMAKKKCVTNITSGGKNSNKSYIETIQNEIVNSASYISDGMTSNMTQITGAFKIDTIA